MSRSRLATVRKVADLRRAGARSAVAAATLARDLARDAERQRADDLDSAAARGADGPDQPAALLVARAAGLSRLADDLLDARRQVSARDGERDEALQAWVAASRNARLLESWCDRAAAAEMAKDEAAAQRLLDDLASRRRTT